MSKYNGNQFNIDNGSYSRKRNPETGKAEGIEKIAIDVGRNTKCPCDSGMKFKNCCDKKGAIYLRRQKKSSRLTNLKIKFLRILKK